MLLIGLIPPANAETTTTDKPTQAELREKALEDYAFHWGTIAYIWGWPAVNLHNRCAGTSRVTEPGRMGGILPGAPLNYACVLTDYIQEGQHGCIDPNQDVVYGSGWADLSIEPVVIQIPDFGNRFWILHLMDAYTNVPVSPGTRMNSKPGFYMLVGPDWKGKVPAGTTEVIHIPTNLLWFLPRAFVKDTAEDHAAIQPYLSKVNAYPLSEYDGKVKVKDWNNVPTFPATPSDNPSEVRWVRDEAFWEDFAKVLAENKPLPEEVALYYNFKRLLKQREKDPAIKRGMDRAVADGSKIVQAGFPLSNQSDQFGYGWAGDLKGGQWGDEYLRRAWVCKGIIGVNKPIDAFYFGTDLDETGAPLNGKNNYTITFPKGEPPDQIFWSITLYNQYRLWFKNPLKRYSLGTKNFDSIKFNDDGSLTLYIQKDSPGPDKESNWLPSPDGEPFGLQIRIYIPKENVLKGEYIPPPVKLVK